MPHHHIWYKTLRWHDFVIDPDNAPLRKPGVYLLENLINGKHYVGISQNVSKRLSDHAKIGTKGRLPAAIRKHGHKSFRATPLYYSLNGTEGLEEIEARMIMEFNSIDHGYNTIAANGGVGPYGDAYAAVHRARWAVPGAKEIILAQLAAGRQTPQARTNQSRASAEVKNRPHIKAAYADRMAKLRWITNGVVSKRIEPDDQVPDGWRYGRVQDAFQTESYRARQTEHGHKIWTDEEYRTNLLQKRKARWENADADARHSHGAAVHKARLATPEARQKYAETLANMVWITDGISNKRVPSQNPIPDGWKRGKTSKNSKNRCQIPSQYEIVSG